jgi:aryl-alcohol dehydrogenase-like predicted oxidoreductase
VLNYCVRESIGFIPWFPIAAGKLTRDGGLVDQIVTDTGATPAQVALAWLLHRAQIILPIPGTSSVAHLEENVGAAQLMLSREQVAELTDAADEA